MRVKKLVEKAPTSKIKSALFGEKRGIIKTFAVFTAANPLGEPLTDLENRQRNNILRKSIEQDREKADLEKFLRRSYYQYIPIKGRYGYDEPSFIVFNIALSDVMRYCADWKQQQFWFGECENTKDENGNIIQPSATVTCYEYDKAIYERDKKFVYNNVGATQKIYDWSEMADLDDNFSSYGGLTWNFDYYDALANGRIARDEKKLDDALDESVTPKCRLFARLPASFYDLPENRDENGAFLGARKMWETYGKVDREIEEHSKSGRFSVNTLLEKAHAVKDLEERGYKTSVTTSSDGWNIEYKK